MIDTEKKMSMGQTANITLGGKGARVFADSLPSPRKAVGEEGLILNKEWGSSNFAISRSHDFANVAPRQPQPSTSAWIAAAPASEKSLPELYDAFIRGNLAAASEMVKRGNEAIPFFVKALDSESKDVQRTAIVKLGEYGEAAEPALPKLIEFHKEHCNEGILNLEFAYQKDTTNPDLTRTFVSIGPRAVSSLSEELLYFAREGGKDRSQCRTASFKCIDVTLQMLEKFGRRAAPALPALRQVPELFNSDYSEYSWYHKFPESLISAMRAIGPEAVPSLMELVPPPSRNYGVPEHRLEEVVRALDSFGPLPNGTDVVSWTLEYLQDYMNVIGIGIRERALSREKHFVWFVAFKRAVNVLEKSHFEKAHLRKLTLMLLKYSRNASSSLSWFGDNNETPLEQVMDELKKFGVELSLQLLVECLHSKDEAECQEAALALTAYGEQMLPYLDEVISGDAPAACKAAANDARNQLLQKVR